MTTRIVFHQNFHAVDGGGNSYVKYRAGESYAADVETTRLVAAGIAEVLDMQNAPTSANAPIQSPASISAAASE